MNYFNDPLFLRQIIMDHYENPRNKREPEDMDAYVNKHMKTDNCIDDINLFIKINNDVIEDICFTGSACTISTASTSIMTNLLMGKSKREALNIIEEFDQMMRLEDYNEELMQEANAFKNVGRQANRITCARLGWQGVKETLEGVLTNDN